MDAGIVHDNPGDNDECPTIPDVAGIGVIVSCALAAVLTTLASVAAAILDEILLAETAFLPKRLNRPLSKNQNPERIRKWRFRRNVLDRLILSFADQQLVTGFSLMLTGWIVYHDDLDGAHFTLIVYLSCLSSSSHLAAIMTLRKYFADNQTLAFFRITIISSFAVLLSVSISLANAFGPFYFVLYYVTDKLLIIAPPGTELLLSIVPILWTFWTGIWQVVPAMRNSFQARLRQRVWPWIRCAGPGLFWSWIQPRLSERKSWKLKNALWSIVTYICFLSPMTVFLVQILFAVISVFMALFQKFSRGLSDDECSLNSPEENEMGYGQVLAILLLVLPAIATFEAYKEEERKVRVEEAKEGLRPLVALVHKVALSSEELGLQPEMQISEDKLRFLRNIMDGQQTEARAICPPSRRDTEQRVGDPGDSTTVSTTMASHGSDEGSGTITRRGTWESYD